MNMRTDMKQKIKKRKRICMQPQNGTGLVLRGCWLPGTGSVPFSSSPPQAPLSLTSLSPTILIQAGHLLNAALTLPISPSKAPVGYHLPNLPLWCCSCHFLPMASPFSTLQLQAWSQSCYVQRILFSRSRTEHNQTGKWWKTVPHAANLIEHILNAGIKNLNIIIASLLSHLVAP